MNIQQEMAINPNTALSAREIETIAKYCTQGSTSVSPEVVPWMISYLCDKNSSSVREGITAHICGYDWSQDKHHYDAGKRHPHNPDVIIPVEIKPKLFNGTTKNCGEGNFSDLQLKKVQQMKDDNLLMVVSLFAYTRLVYVIEFPFSAIHDRIYKFVKNKIELGNRYCRNAIFGYNDYINCEEFRIVYLDKPRLLGYNCTNKPFTKALLARA